MFLRITQHRHDALCRLFADQCRAIRRGVSWVACAQIPHLNSQSSSKLLADATLSIDALHSDACLSDGIVATCDGASHSTLQVGICLYDERRIVAKFECYALVTGYCANMFPYS